MVRRSILAPLVMAVSAALLCSALVMTWASDSEAVASVRSHEAAAAKRAVPTVIASRTLNRAGGTVRAKNGVAIHVPAGVMKFRGRVEITKRGAGKYGFHIYSRWKGHVTVRLPKLGDRNVIMHKVDRNRWILEDARSDGKGFAKARVNDLSTFTNLFGCLKALKGGPGAAVTVAKCLIRLGIKKVPTWVGKQIIGFFNQYDACQPLSVTNWPSDWADVVSACQLTAPTCELENTCGLEPTPATPTATATPTSPPPTAAPPPPAPNPTFTGGYVIDDAFLGGTWPRTDPGNGTWYSRANRPSNAADYWWANGLGVGFSCGAYAASYSVHFADGHAETWNTWLRSTDTWGGRVQGLWIPSAVARGLNTNGIPPGMPSC